MQKIVKKIQKNFNRVFNGVIIGLKNNFAGQKSGAKLNANQLFLILFGIGTIFSAILYFSVSQPKMVPRAQNINDDVPTTPVQIGSTKSDNDQADSELKSDNILKNKILGSYFSSENPYSDFSSMRDSGLNFLFIRATQDSKTKDALFDVSTKRAKEADIPYGDVLFYDPYVSSFANYDFFAKTVGNNIGTLPIAIDISNISDPGAIPDVIQLVANLKENYPNHSVLVRTDQTLYEQIKQAFITNSVDAKIWLVANNDQNTDSINQFVQYTGAGKIGSGLHEYTIPLSFFNGDQKEFDKLIQANVQTNNSQEQTNSTDENTNTNVGDGQ
ncbi:MAG: hypothetical protein LBC17_01210 [Lactobacillaceae bacterium]|jgi:lysozyme|nr:hypothetical protein [Lactobacillaceae bacterium]